MSSATPTSARVGGPQGARCHGCSAVTAYAPLAWTQAKIGELQARLADLENIISSREGHGPALPGSPSFDASAGRIKERAEQARRSSRP